MEEKLQEVVKILREHMPLRKLTEQEGFQFVHLCFSQEGRSMTGFRSANVEKVLGKRNCPPWRQRLSVKCEASFGRQLLCLKPMGSPPKRRLIFCELRNSRLNRVI